MMKRDSYGLATLLALAAAPIAQAYVDPGSGALLWQALMAGVVGSLFYLRRGIEWLRAHLRRDPEREP